MSRRGKWFIAEKCGRSEPTPCQSCRTSARPTPATARTPRPARTGRSRPAEPAWDPSRACPWRGLGTRSTRSAGRRSWFGMPEDPIGTQPRRMYANQHEVSSSAQTQHTVTAHSTAHSHSTQHTAHTAHSTVTAHSHSAVTARSIEQRVMETARHGTAVTALVEASEERWVKLPSKVTVPTAPGRTASPMSSRSQTSATHRRICCANRETQSRGENGFVFCLSCDRTWRRCGLRKTWCAGDQGRGSAVPRGGGDLRRVGCKQKACWVG